MRGGLCHLDHTRLGTKFVFQRPVGNMCAGCDLTDQQVCLFAHLLGASDASQLQQKGADGCCVQQYLLGALGEPGQC